MREVRNEKGVKREQILTVNRNPNLDINSALDRLPIKQSVVSSTQHIEVDRIGARIRSILNLSWIEEQGVFKIAFNYKIIKLRLFKTSYHIFTF